MREAVGYSYQSNNVLEAFSNHRIIRLQRVAGLFRPVMAHLASKLHLASCGRKTSAAASLLLLLLSSELQVSQNWLIYCSTTDYPGERSQNAIKRQDNADRDDYLQWSKKRDDQRSSAKRQTHLMQKRHAGRCKERKNTKALVRKGCTVVQRKERQKDNWKDILTSWGRTWVQITFGTRTESHLGLGPNRI